MTGRRALLAVLALLVAAGVLLRVHMVWRSSTLLEYDPHFGYAEEIRERLGGQSLPSIIRGSGNYLRWHPPAYHVLAAAVGSLYPQASAVPVKIFTLACNLLTVWLLWLLLRHFFGDDYGVILPSLALLVFLPGHIVFSNIAINDVLFVPMCALLLLLSFRWGTAAPGTGGVVALSLLCGFALLTKYTGFACLAYLNAVLLEQSRRTKISAGRYFALASTACAIPLLMAGWFYWMNYQAWGDPVYLPGWSGARELSILSFDFGGLLASRVNRWHQSESVLTGFFASFFSFDWIHAQVREPGLRNAVFCLALPLSLIAGVGAASAAVKERFRSLNIFALISLILAARLLWGFERAAGEMKASYLMYLAPVCAIYFAEGCSFLRARSIRAFQVCVASVLILSLTVGAYYWRYFRGPGPELAVETAPEAPYLDPVEKVSAAADKGDLKAMHSLLTQLPIAKMPAASKTRLAELCQRAERVSFERSAKAPPEVARLRAKALDYQAAGDHGSALRILDRLIAARPKDAGLRGDRGVIHVLRGRTGSAIRDFEAAIAADPTLPSGYLSLAGLYEARKEQGRSLSVYEAALREACYPLDGELCALMGARQECFLRATEACGLIARERARLLRLRGPVP